MSALSMDRFAVMSVQFVQYSFDHYLKSMVKCGYKHIDFWGGLPHYCRLDYPNQKVAKLALEKIRAKIDKAGLDVVMYTPETLAYPFSLSSERPETIKRTLEYFEMAMHDAKVLGTNRVFLNSGCAPRDKDLHESMNRLIQNIRTLCEIAQTYGITIVMEQLQPYESNLVIDLPSMKRVLDEVDMPNLKVCIDVVAMEVAKEKLEDYFENLPDMIDLIHLADENHYILGEGHFPIKEYLNKLLKFGYQGYITLEINDSIYWLNPHESLEKTTKALKVILDS